MHHGILFTWHYLDYEISLWVSHQFEFWKHIESVLWMIWDEMKSVKHEFRILLQFLKQIMRSAANMNVHIIECLISSMNFNQINHSQFNCCICDCSIWAVWVPIPSSSLHPALNPLRTHVWDSKTFPLTIVSFVNVRTGKFYLFFIRFISVLTNIEGCEIMGIHSDADVAGLAFTIRRQRDERNLRIKTPGVTIEGGRMERNDI